jgi:uncharacterized protein YjeT (DUF2065 family)
LFTVVSLAAIAAWLATLPWRKASEALSRVPYFSWAQLGLLLLFIGGAAILWWIRNRT